MKISLILKLFKLLHKKLYVCLFTYQGERFIFLINMNFSSYDSNLVDPASSHMLVLKIKPCMSKYK